jgi:hypothetical protein
MSGDWTNGISVAVMAARLTPKQAARVKYYELLFRPEDPDSYDLRIDALLRNNIGHQWFCFCLDAIARQGTS